MTVAELIKELEKFGPEQHVMIGSEWGFFRIYEETLMPSPMGGRLEPLKFCRILPNYSGPAEGKADG